MKIVHEKESRRIAAYADDGTEIGRLLYSPHGGSLSATHTWTDEKYRGRGVAAKMLDALVGYAQERDMTIIPVCPYVKAAFEKDPGRFKPAT